MDGTFLRSIIEKYNIVYLAWCGTIASLGGHIHDKFI